LYTSTREGIASKPHLANLHQQKRGKKRQREEELDRGETKILRRTLSGRQHWAGIKALPEQLNISAITSQEYMWKDEIFELPSRYVT
jgi:hypothetical protein